MRTGFAATRALGLVGLLAVAGPAAAAPGETARGEQLFQRDCASCHQIGPGAISLSTGPTLNGIIGMPAGDEPGFTYSTAAHRSAVIWSAKTFDAFIADPQAMIPGTTMTYAGMPETADRRALFAYVSRFDAHGVPR